MIKGMDHVGISVQGLERSIAFYCTGFGMEVTFKGTFEGERYSTILNLPGATGRMAVLSGPNVQLELFEFSYPAPRRGDPKRPVCDHGITHFGIAVVGIAQAYERLKTVGATFHCPPLEFPGEGVATYGRDPDGNVFELLELSATTISS